jgi:hypothetical protein
MRHKPMLAHGFGMEISLTATQIRLDRAEIGKYL